MYLDKLIAWCRDNNVVLKIEYDKSLGSYCVFKFIKFVDGRPWTYARVITENEIFDTLQNEFLIELLIKEVSYKFEFIKEVYNECAN